VRNDLNKILIILCCILGLSLSTPLISQQSSEFIFAKVTTKSSDVYEGFVRWGKEEVSWHDVFNSVKIQQKHIKDRHKNLWKDFNWNISSIWEDKYRETSHTFACFFGDIKAIYPESSSKLDLVLKNGTVLKLEGGSNDVGATIQLHDQKLGLVLVPWNKMEKIEFAQAPKTNKLPYGNLIYGTVHTYRKGKIEGYIKWDLDERATKDKLDGYYKGKDYSISFDKIKSIQRYENGALVRTNYDKEIFLTGTNDVNSGNRGIAIYNHEIGRIELDWKEFKKLELHENYKKGPGYNDFEKPEGIHAQVLTYGDMNHDGMIIYDIDEKWELELIDGNDDNLRYQIPIRNIRTIYPKNKAYSVIFLKNGDQLLLGERQDVSGTNDGILLFMKSQKEPIHVNWSEIVEINIKE